MKLGSFLELALLLLVIAVPIAGAENATELIWYVGPEMAPCMCAKARKLTLLGSDYLKSITVKYYYVDYLWEFYAKKSSINIADSISPIFTGP